MTSQHFPSGVAITSRVQVVSIIAALALVVTLPAWATPGFLFLAGLTLIHALFALSWNLLFGYAGLASFGHAGFFAIGAYLTGAALRYEWLPFPLAIVASMALGAAVAWLIGMIALQRLAGIFLAVLTVALSEILRRIISYVPALGGEDGLSNIPRASFGFGPVAIPLTSSTAYYFFIVFMFVIVTTALWWLVNSRIGRAFKSVRDDAERAAFLGTNVKHYRLMAFMISGAVAALAGSIFAPWTRIVTLEEVHWLMSTQPILSTLLGGTGSFWGPIVGSVAFTVINYSTRTFVGLSEIMVGGILLAIILLAPAGILGLAGQFLRRRTAALDAPAKDAETRS